MKMTIKQSFSALIKSYKKTKRTFLLTEIFDTSDGRNYNLTMMSVIVVICQISCVILLFRAFMSFYQHNERRWLIFIYYHAFHSPDGAI